MYNVMAIASQNSNKENKRSQGAHGAVAKATGWEAPAQGSNPRCGTKLQVSPLGYLFQKKGEQNDQKKFLEHAEELCIFLLRRRNGPITKLQAPPWTRMVPEKRY